MSSSDLAQPVHLIGHYIFLEKALDAIGKGLQDPVPAMNKARQGAITQELAEISGGVEAMEQ